jgi:hypothetical protein
MDNKNIKICKFFVNNNCRHGDKCKYIHETDVCKKYFFEGKCIKNDMCKFKHSYTINFNTESFNNIDKSNVVLNKYKKRQKNTENFNPNHNPCDMNILFNKSQKSYKENDVIIVNNIIEENYKYEIFEQLLKEMDETNLDNLWKSWHGNNHLIADDNLNWKDKVPTFDKIIKIIEEYFNMEVKGTRFNLYENSSDWKPFHHDAAAVKEHIAQIQNFTVGISFGAIRDIAFEHGKTKTTISIPLENCCAYAFSKNINIDWKHGIPQIHPDKAFDKGRISIIAWGKISIDV